ncbi:CUB and sushi domain-containing protein 1 [Mugil cephalus]|uniref:CUB and sushi domain-containing protein 1 n=1 Tax=Mugil cephalus TaxID=48193 RepID=UPI001FB7749A|nr:CUB and sushi domain-containing protein 1 [Mugil cephalus]
MEILAALVALVWYQASVCGGEGCSGFRHLDNGQTFFRYGGLLVVFRCHPGYKLHGYKTNSCVSGHWSRDPPVCVGSGCPHPGPLSHGMSSMNEDGSWAGFSCDSGFRLRGPSMLYCNGRTWNGTKPACKESDMMSSFSGVTVPKLNTHHGLRTYYDRVDFKFGLLSQTPTQKYNSESSNTTNPKAHIQKPIPSLKDEGDGQADHRVARAQTASERPEKGNMGHDSEANASQKMDEATQTFALKSHLSTTVSSAMLLESGTKPATFSFMPHAPVRPTATSQNDVTRSVVATTSDKHQQAQTSPSPPSVYSIPTSPSPISRPAASASSSPNVTFPLNSHVVDSRSPWTERHNLTTNSTPGTPFPSTSFSHRPVCPYPPVPAHGTFHFRNVEDPGPGEYRHYIQYACYPRYTLAHGDIHSYCQRGGTWSGTTPVCLELTPCSVNNGGCSQLCYHSPHYNQSSNQTQTGAQCRCRPGFSLMDDRRTCRDLDECAEGLHRCQQRCTNTFGSFKCSCDSGYQPAQNQTSCADVDECLLPAAVMGCVFGCVNTPGSFHCQCPAGYRLTTADGHCRDIDECAAQQGLGPCMEQCHNSPGSYRCSCTHGRILAPDGHSCVAECPSGYRRQPAATLENSTAQTLEEECVDINECQEEVCEWQCLNLPGSHHCICPRGYTLQRDGQRCKDINECDRNNGWCSHLCLNQRGGYKCACPASHRLSSNSWKKCLPRTTANSAG